MRILWRLRRLRTLLRSPLGLVVGAALVGTGGLFWVVRQPSASQFGRPASGPLVHVCFCTDDTDLRPLAVAINSTLLSSRHPENLVFHVITTLELVPIYSDLLRAHLPPVVLELHHDEDLMFKLLSLALFQENSTASGRPGTRFMLVPFNIHRFLGPAAAQVGRIVYLHTDVVVQGDIAELYRADLQDHPVAVVQDCTRFSPKAWAARYERLALGLRQPPRCRIKPGIFVADLLLWKRLGISERLESWASQFHGLLPSQERAGLDLSLVPLWLMTDSGYAQLDASWNCDSLSRGTMKAADMAHLRSGGFDDAMLKTVGATQIAGGSVKPAVITCSLAAKLLHFNGQFKPWKMESDDLADSPSMCSVSNSMLASPRAWKRVVRVIFKGSPMTFVLCAELWLMRLSPADACALRDFDKEWEEDELVWTGVLPQKREAVVEEDDTMEEATTTSAPPATPLPAAPQQPPPDSAQGASQPQAPAQQQGQPRAPVKASSSSSSSPSSSSRSSGSKQGKLGSWSEVKERLNRLSTSHLKRSFSVLGIPVPQGGKDKLVTKLIEYLQAKEREKVSKQQRRSP